MAHNETTQEEPLVLFADDSKPMKKPPPLTLDEQLAEEAMLSQIESRFFGNVK